MTQPENQIAHSKLDSSQEHPRKAQSTPAPTNMKSAFSMDDAEGQGRIHETNGTVSPPHGNHSPSQGPQAPVDPSAPGSDPEESTKKWGLSSLLSRGRSGSVPLKADTTSSVSAAPSTSTTTKGGWFSGRRSKHSSRASSADPVLSLKLPEIAVHLPGEATAPTTLQNSNNLQGNVIHNNSSPRRGISISAPVSTTVTPNIEPLALLEDITYGTGDGIGSGKDKKGVSSHRRHRSLLETLGWSKPARSVASTASNSGDLDSLEDGDKSNDTSNGSGGGGGGGGALTGQDDGNLSTSNKLALSSTDIELLEVQLPPAVPFATRGMSNMGNSCFLNAAIQCLRHTPGLPLILVPDLLERAEQRAKEQEEAHAQAISAAAKAAADAAAAHVVKEQEEEKAVAEVALESNSNSAPKETVAALAVAQISAPAGVLKPTASSPGVEEQASIPLNQPHSAGENELILDTSVATTNTVGEEEKKENNSATAPLVEKSPAAIALAPAPLPRPSQGELASAVASLFTELYLNPVTNGPGYSASGTTAMAPAVSPLTLLSVLRRFPTAADYFDGRQQDCQEVLQILLDLLHEDLNTVVQQPNKKEPEADTKEDEEEIKSISDGDGDGEEKMKVENKKDNEDEIKKENGGLKETVQAVRTASTGLPPRPPTPSTSPLIPPLLPPPPPLIKNNITSNAVDKNEESLKADSAWSSWRRTTDSPISDLFMGQLQSSVTCSKCGGRFTMYEPFWELSLPLAPKSGGAFSWLTFKAGGSSLSLQDCLRAFTTGEKLDGKEAFSCEKCGEKTTATKHLRLHRLPDALVLHVKRFKHGGAGGGGDKLTTDVVFPVHSLDLHGHLSPESPHPSEECIYDLYAVSYHTGSLIGGHYLACCRLSPPPPQPPAPPAESNHSSDNVSMSTSNGNSTVNNNSSTTATADDGTSSLLSSPVASPLVRAGSAENEKKNSKNKKKDTTSTPTWWLFNDESVTPVADDNVKTQNAYILFYARRKYTDSNAAAAVFASRDAKGKSSSGDKSGTGSGYHHRRSASSGGSGSGGASFLFGNRNKTNTTPVAAAAAASPTTTAAAGAAKENGNESC